MKILYITLNGAVDYEQMSSLGGGARASLSVHQQAKRYMDTTMRIRRRSSCMRPVVAFLCCSYPQYFKISISNIYIIPSRDGLY